MTDDLGGHPTVGARLRCEHGTELRVVRRLDRDAEVGELDPTYVGER